MNLIQTASSFRVDSLNRDQQEQLLPKLRQIKAEWDLNRLKNVKPNPGFQENFFKSKAKIRFITAGNQGGKTFIGAVEHALYALGEHPYKQIRIPNIGRIVTAKGFKEGIEGEIVPKLKEVCGSRDIKNIRNNSQGIPTMIEWRTGSITNLMSAEQDDVAFESKTIHHAWIDEPVRRLIYIATLRGGLTTGIHVWITATPLDEPWLYDEIYVPGVEKSDPDIEVFEGSSDENTKIIPEEKAKFKARLTSDEIEARWYGKFQHLAGRVFKSYSPDKHRIAPFDIPYHWPVWCGIDPHRHKPHCAVFIAVSPQGIKYVVNEIYVPVPINTLATYILDIASQYNMVNFLIDTSAQEDGWGKMSARQMLAEKGIITKLAQKKNKKESGIVLINQLFSDNELFVFDFCLRTHRELINQTYKQNKRDTQIVLEEPEKKFDDACLVSGTKIATLFGLKNIEEVRPNDRVITPFGLKRVTAAGPNNYTKVCTNIGLTGTLDHPVFTFNAGFKRLDSIRQEDILSRLRKKELSLWRYKRLSNCLGSDTIETGRPAIIEAAKETLSDGCVREHFMSQCGRLARERKFQKVFTFITRMAISVIMTCLTWNAYRLGNMLRGIKTLLLEPNSMPGNGTALPRAEHGIPCMQPRYGSLKRKLASFAEFVISCFGHTSPQGLIFAEEPAGSSLEGSREDGMSKEVVLFAEKGLKQTSMARSQHAISNAGHGSSLNIVYNLTVEDDGVYYANGVLTSNTDSIRYILIENPTYAGVAKVKEMGPLYQRT